MRKIKVNINRPKLTAQDLAGKKDFSTLLSTYQAVPVVVKPFFKAGWFITSVIATVVTVSIFVYMNSGNLQIAEKPESRMSQVTILAKDSIQKDEKDMLSVRVIETEILGSIETLEKIQPKEKAVEQMRRPDFENFPALPEEVKGKNDINLELLREEIATLNELIAEMENDKKMKPEKARGFRFKLDAPPEEFPEFRDYNGLLWEVGPEEQNKNFDPSLLEKEWDEGKLKAIKNKESYKLTLRRDKLSYSFIVYPVLQGNEYDKALQIYQNHQKKLDSLTLVRDFKVKLLEVHTE